jgi:hypothetical protein
LQPILKRPVLMQSMLRRPVLLAGAALLAALPACGQYPGQVKTGRDTPQIRAIGVLEWTGDEEKPKASRLVPVAVYDGEVLQDGGIYLARPAPLAVSSEVEYELKQNGKTVGLFDIDSAGQEQGSWVGLGRWRALPKPKPVAPVTTGSNKDEWGNENEDRPVLHRKAQSGGSSSSGKDSDDDSGSTRSAQDPDRPTLHKKESGDNSGDSSPSSTSSSPAADPDRPTMHKKTSDDDSASSSAPTDPDRPTLKKKKKEDAKPAADVGYVESMSSTTDPSRPRLMRGKPADQGGTVLPTVMGLPPDMHQAVAVSDAKSRPEHLWSFSWASPDDEAKMKADMEDLARKALGIAVPPAPPPAASKTKATTAARSSSATRKTKMALPPPPPVPLLDEQFRVFELSYGSGATMVLSAHTDGTGAQQKFVTLVGQPNLYGNVVVLMKNVTDAAHLDETPRLRLVDAVDALADNRGELLFELRGATQRQFALYRVLRGQVDKLFVSGLGAIAPQMSEATADPHS